jgi:hypothetical protein
MPLASVPRSRQPSAHSTGWAVLSAVLVKQVEADVCESFEQELQQELAKELEQDFEKGFHRCRPEIMVAILQRSRCDWSGGHACRCLAFNAWASGRCDRSTRCPIRRSYRRKRTPPVTLALAGLAQFARGRGTGLAPGASRIPPPPPWWHPPVAPTPSATRLAVYPASAAVAVAFRPSTR